VLLRRDRVVLRRAENDDLCGAHLEFSRRALLFAHGAGDRERTLLRRSLRLRPGLRGNVRFPPRRLGGSRSRPGRLRTGSFRRSACCRATPGTVAEAPHLSLIRAIGAGVIRCFWPLSLGGRFPAPVILRPTAEESREFSADGDGALCGQRTRTRRRTTALPPSFPTNVKTRVCGPGGRPGMANPKPALPASP